MARVRGYTTRKGFHVPSYSRRRRSKTHKRPIKVYTLPKRRIKRDSYGRFYD